LHEQEDDVDRGQANDQPLETWSTNVAKEVVQLLWPETGHDEPRNQREANHGKVRCEERQAALALELGDELDKDGVPAEIEES
jgi:hypothetical protein